MGPTPAPTPAPTAAPTPIPTPGCQCGRANRVSKIVGGSAASENEYPWQAGLIGSQFSTRPFCGGTLISNKEILTAAHCTQNGVSWVLLGEHDLTASDGEQRLKVCSVTDHPSYDAQTTNYDYSILTLCEEVTFRTDIQPACLPPKANYAAANKDVSKEGLLGAGDNIFHPKAVVSGWGTL